MSYWSTSYITLYRLYRVIYLELVSRFHVSWPLWDFASAQGGETPYLVHLHLSPVDSCLAKQCWQYLILASLLLWLQVATKRRKQGSDTAFLVSRLSICPKAECKSVLVWGANGSGRSFHSRLFATWLYTAHVDTVFCDTDFLRFGPKLFSQEWRSTCTTVDCIQNGEHAQVLPVIHSTSRWISPLASLFRGQ